MPSHEAELTNRSKREAPGKSFCSVHGEMGKSKTGLASSAPASQVPQRRVPSDVSHLQPPRPSSSTILPCLMHKWPSSFFFSSLTTEEEEGVVSDCWLPCAVYKVNGMSVILDGDAPESAEDAS